MKYSIALVSLACMVAMVSVGVEAMPPAPCIPGLLEDVPARIRKVCALLSTVVNFDNVMEDYARRNGKHHAYETDETALSLGDPSELERIPLLGSSGVKRQDVDHVFLRFGRKR